MISMEHPNRQQHEAAATTGSVSSQVNMMRAIRISPSPGIVHRSGGLTKKHLLFTAAAALSTTIGTPQVEAFVVQRPIVQPFLATRRYSQTRLHLRKDEGILAKVKSAAKSVLPSSWFQTEEEKQIAIERQRVRDEFKGGLQELLKDAPLPVRMLGRMIEPLVSSMVGGLVEALAEQERETDEVVAKAAVYLMNDEAVARLLGNPIEIDDPVSLSYSSEQIDGKTITKMEITLPVSGPVGSGMTQVEARNGVIQRLKVLSGGEVISLSLSGSTRSKGIFKGPSGGDAIIEAEIIEKEPKK